MKNAIELRFAAVTSVPEAERHVIRVRFAEALHRQSALSNDDDDNVHAFRLSCKRLRFAIERVQPHAPQLAPVRALLSRLTDVLGWAHDCAELAELAQEEQAPLVATRARRDRDRYVTRARRLWRHAFRSEGEFAPLAQYAGYTWSTP